MSVKYAILGLLHYKDMHGYRIKEHIERNFGFMWSINYGQIYPNLKQMEEDGLISMTEINDVGKKGPSRKQYSITEKGREDFSEWLSSAPERRLLLRDPFLTRFVFLGFGDKEHALELIDEQIALYEKQMKDRYDNLQRWQRHSIYVRLIAELGVNFNEMALDWLKRSREAIEKSTEEELAAAVYI